MSTPKKLSPKKPVPLVGLTRKSTEAQIQRNIRVNQHMSSAGDLPFAKDKVNPRYIAGGAVLLPKLEGAALPNRASIWDRDQYRIGDGEIRQQTRIGSDNAMKIQSRGFRT